MNSPFDGAATGDSAALRRAGTVALDRAGASYTPRYQRFLVKSRVYSQQYSHIYSRRIAQLRGVVTAAAHAKWSDASAYSECSKVIDLRPGSTTEWLVVGCIYKDQPLKPSILDEFRYVPACLSAGVRV